MVELGGIPKGLPPKELNQSSNVPGLIPLGGLGKFVTRAFNKSNGSWGNPLGCLEKFVTQAFAKSNVPWVKFLVGF